MSNWEMHKHQLTAGLGQPHPATPTGNARGTDASAPAEPADGRAPGELPPPFLTEWEIEPAERTNGESRSCRVDGERRFDKLSRRHPIHARAKARSRSERFARRFGSRVPVPSSCTPPESTVGRILVVGGLGHLGSTRLQPVLQEMPGIADCLDFSAAQNLFALPERSLSPAPFARIFNVATELVPCLLGVAAGAYSVIFLATAPTVAEEYVELLASCVQQSCLVVVEKPWASSAAAARRLESLLDQSCLAVRYNDHFLYKPVFTWLVQQPLPFFLGGPIQSIRCRLFEATGALSVTQGSTGVLDDLLVHGLTVIKRLLPAASLQLTRAFGGKHDQWTYASPSYASLDAMIDTGRSLVPVSVAAAKDHHVTAKVLVLEGPDASMHIDFAQDCADLMFSDGSQRRLFPDHGSSTNTEGPYEFLLRQLVNGRGENIGLDRQEAIIIRAWLDEAQGMHNDPLPSYQKGTYPIDPSVTPFDSHPET